jgi:hypothetical protein
MEMENEDNLRKLIRDNAGEQASSDFTDRVLMGIQGEFAYQNATDATLKLLLTNHALESPSAEFQSHITRQLTSSTSIVYKPIIPKKSWYAIVVSILLLLPASYFFPSESTSEVPGVIELTGQSARNLIPTDIFSGSSQMLLITLLGSASLLLLDYLLRQRYYYKKLARS